MDEGGFEWEGRSIGYGAFEGGGEGCEEVFGGVGDDGDCEG